MRSWLPVPAGLAVVLLGTLVVYGCAKDEETAPPARGVFAPTPSGREQGAQDISPTATPADAAGCDALGSLVGNGLEASLASATRRSVAVPLVSRPMATRVTVQGVGASGDLSGKTIALGVAANIGNETCTHCLLITVGCSGDDCSNATYYFPRSGNATFTTVASAAGQPFGGRFSDVILEHVTIDPATGATHATGDGRCLYVKDLTFNALVPRDGTVTPPPTDDAGVGGDSGLSVDKDGGGAVGSSSGGGGNGETTDSADTESTSGGTSKGGGGGGGGTL